LPRQLHRDQHRIQFDILPCAPPREAYTASKRRRQAQAGPRLILPEKLVHSLHVPYLRYLSRIATQKPLPTHWLTITQVLKGQDDLPQGVAMDHAPLIELTQQKLSLLFAPIYPLISDTAIKHSLV
jgi:hypothetical protein